MVAIVDASLVLMLSFTSALYVRTSLLSAAGWQAHMTTSKSGPQTHWSHTLYTVSIDNIDIATTIYELLKYQVKKQKIKHTHIVAGA